MGGNWPGNPGASTVFPQQLVVDYIRVYQDTTSTEVDDLEYNSAPAKYELAQNYPNPCNPIQLPNPILLPSNYTMS